MIELNKAIKNKRIINRYKRFKETEMIICTRCKEDKHYLEFSKNKNSLIGRDYKCKKCRSREYSQYLRANRNSHLKRSFGISIEDYEMMLKDQNGVCATCLSPPKDSLRVDHDHNSGLIRGLLCHNCNVVLGLVKDDLTILGNLYEYIKNSKWQSKNSA